MKLIMLKTFTLLTGSTLALNIFSAANAFDAFTNRVAWETAIAGSITTTDTFSNNIAQAQSIILDSGIVSTNSFPPSVSLTDNSVSLGEYLNATDGDGVDASATVTWVFPSPVFAFGANFIGTDLNGLTINGNFDGTGNESRIVHNTLGGENGFLGIVSTVNFSTIVFGNNSTDLDEFIIDNASSARTYESSLVAALAMIGLSFVLGKKINND